jgi:hypothetical protein
MKFCTVFLTIAIASAQTAANKSVIGEVTGVDSVAKQLAVKGDDGSNYTVTLQDNTAYFRLPLGEKDLKKAEKITFSEVVAGDRVLARGPLPEGSQTLPARIVVIMTKADLAKKQAQDRADWQRRGIAGTIVSINSDTKEITINTHRRDAPDVVIDTSSAGFRRYAADSVRFADATPSAFAELKPGDSVRALGDKSADGTHYKAEELVSGSFHAIAAIVDSVDPATGEVQVTDLVTKKNFAVKTNRNSMLRRLPEMMAMMLARRMRADAGGGPPGAPEGRGRAEAEAAPPEGRGGFGRGRGGFGGPGGPGGRAGFGNAGGTADLQQLLERAPQLSLAELKKGDALIISSSQTEGPTVTAIALVAGVEPFLAAAPRTGGQVNLGSWNLEPGVPEQ